MTWRSLFPVFLCLGFPGAGIPALSAASPVAIPSGSEWTYWKGTGDPSPEAAGAWREAAFDDRGWALGRAPFYYGQPFAGTVLSDMEGRYSGVYFRRAFVVDDPGKVSRVSLDALVDDGFAAWINGHEVARYNVPEGELGLGALALEPAPDPLLRELFLVVNPGAPLVRGTNWLAVQALNASLRGSSDFVWDASLEIEEDTTAPTLVDAVPGHGARVESLEQVEVTFSEDVVGVDAADFLVNGLPATNVVRISPNQYLFSFPPAPAGRAELAWAPGHGITDPLLVGNPFTGASWTVTIDPGLGLSGLRISEFLALNEKGLLDEDKDSSDWIELYNSGASPVSLAGCTLTDDALNPGKWTFPDVVIGARAYLVVFASDKNKTNPVGRLHTNFRLTTDGEYLGLYGPDGKVISDFAPSYPPQRVNVSYGRMVETPELTGYFATPTPGGANLNSGDGFGPAVRFSRGGGAYTEPFLLEMLSDNPEAVIRYTQNGTLPTATSTLYQGPLRIEGSVEIRARAFEPGKLPGPPQTISLVRLNADPAIRATYSSTLPILLMTTSGRAALGTTRNQAVGLALYEPVNGRATLTGVPAWTSRGGAKVRGSSTEGLAKQSWALEIWDEFDNNRDREILGMPSESEWVLYGPNDFDKPFIHNPFIHTLSRDIGQYSPRTRFVEVYYHRTGTLASNQWYGIYVLEERIKIGKDRVDAGKLRPEDVLPPEVTGGYLMKTDRLDPGDTGISVAGATIAMVEPRERELKSAQRAPQLAYLRQYITALNSSLPTTASRDFTRRYEQYIDVPQWIDHHILEVLSGNVDAIVLSSYFHKVRNGRLLYGPHWDFDRALGSTDGRDVNPRNWVTGPFFSGWYQRLFSSRDAWQQWIDRYQDLRGKELATPYINRLIDQLADEVRPSAAREIRRWNNRPRGVGYQAEVVMMKNWVSNRLAFIDSQTAQPPRLSSPGGLVTPGFTLTLTAPPGATLFYTLDGSDPRAGLSLTNLGGTNPAPTARVYAGPIVIATNARVVVRSRDLARQQRSGPPVSTPWSRPVAATFTVAPPALAVTEIMFHPPATPDGSPFGGDEFEYVELMNISDRTVPLDGVHFTEGIEFRFGPETAIRSLAPGERVVVARNPEAFRSRYPGVTPVVGGFAGGLSDSGETLALAGPLEEPLFRISYRDDWNRLADGAGFSLVVRDESRLPAELDDPVFWRASAQVSGSPGEVDPAPARVPEVFVNELFVPVGVSGKPWVEVLNPGAGPVDISTWFVTDDPSNPRKAAVQRRSIVPAGGYLVLGGEVGDLKFAEGGDGVYLISADAEGNLTGWIHGFRYTRAEKGTTLGRQSGVPELLVPEREASPGRRNVGARLSPVVLHQIYFRPRGVLQDLRLEFVQIRNVSGEVVPLFDPGRPARTWRLRGDVDFDFPRNVSLNPGEIRILVSFIPSADVPAMAAFQEHHALVAPRQMLGPWEGHLDESRGRLRLEMPDPVSDAAEARYVVMEELEYSSAPASLGWPVAGRNGQVTLGRSRTGQPAGFVNSWVDGEPCPADLDSNFNGLPDGVERALGSDPFVMESPARFAVFESPLGQAAWYRYRLGFPVLEDALRLNVLPSDYDLIEYHLRFLPSADLPTRIERSESPETSPWTTMTTVPPTTAVGPVTVVDRSSTISRARFYRAVRGP